eukprot:TRINITY_DN6884_c0_g1_i1.p1 TRINITY_DN6884_c0_g1~~TRINITY_DN6884_c0_g1_i1.p1  ORF type:complete len:275 (+),score=75.39 TRINITY_DN6884_c0_g1_i1:38-862(+)
MPLVVMCGIPTSGKSTRALEIQKYINETQPDVPVQIINEESLQIDKNVGYKGSLQEKSTRGSLKAAVERHLSRNNLIIIDSLNYIKGYRYELYCISRSLSTPQCIVHCDTTKEVAKEWNSNRADKYEDSLQEELSNRFETPNPKNRWDKPLFSLRPDEPTPCNLISDALFNRSGPTPNSATVPAVLAAPNFLHELDKVTQDIVNVILEASQQGTALPGDYITVPGTPQKFVLKRNSTLAELRRLRRQFIKVSQLHPPPNDAIGDAFVTYLNGSF